jgi:DNA-binding NarL/FixJ family response regulator
VIEGETPPPSFEGRAVPAWIVGFLADEIEDLLAGRAGTTALDAAQLSLARLLSQGLTTHEIAKELRLDPRTVQRQTARLRQRFGVATKAELAVALAEAGI